MRIKLEEKHYQWGLTAFLVILCSVLLFFGIYKFHVVAEFCNTVVRIMSPFIYGLVMAYLLCPIYNASVRQSYSILNKNEKNPVRSLKFSKAIASVISIAVLFIVFGGIVWMIIPGLIDSIVKVVEVVPDGADRFMEWVNRKFVKYPMVKETIDSYVDSAMTFATNTIIPKAGTMATEFSAKLILAVRTLMNVIIGVIVCVYFLNIKDNLAAQMKKVIYANFKENSANEVLTLAEYTNKTFNGFITGKIIDSAIIGCICFVIMSIFGWEYTLLISSIVAITNIIPFFGPFIGAIPSTLLLLIVNPMHAVYFMILILLLQQFDGNILGPKILGDSTGLASFWVLFAILVGGGLFGFIGMVIGVPVFAVIYAYCARALNRKLQNKGLSIKVEDYKVDKYTIKRKGTIRKKFTFLSRIMPLKDDDVTDKADESKKAGGHDELDVDAFMAAHEHHAPHDHLIVDEEKYKKEENR